MQYVSGQYEYPVRALNHALAKSEQAFYEEVCVQQPGKKVFVQVEGAVEFLLTHFPENSVLILVANELGNWGLTHKDRAIGPHGPGQPFETSEDGHIILPPQIMPYFRQYYSQQIWDAWGDDVRFFPLGSRQEFPQPDPARFPSKIPFAHILCARHLQSMQMSSDALLRCSTGRMRQSLTQTGCAHGT